MLKKGLENGHLVMSYLTEGNYSLVTQITEKWHQVFTDFQAKFYITDAPLEVMLKSKKIFYYDSWKDGIIKFLISWMVTIGLSYLLFKLSFRYGRYMSIIIAGFAIVISISGFGSDMISFPKPSRRNWYPAAVDMLEKMTTSRDYLHSETSMQIDLILELRKHTEMYQDKTVQKDVDQLVHNLATAVRQTSAELGDLYSKNTVVISTYRQARGNIERAAERAGRLNEAHDLLVALDKGTQKYEEFQRNLQVLVTHQQKVLPILKEQTQSIRALVQSDRLIEISQLIRSHQDTLLDIDGNTYKVQIEIQHMIEILDNDEYNGLKKSIETLKEETVSDQLKAMLYGIGGTVSGAVTGALALKTGLAIVSVTATAVAAPVALTAGTVGLGYVAVHNYLNYQGASRYQKELNALETNRIKWKTAMEQYQKAIDDQQKALQSSQSSLNKISTYSNQFSKISGFTLNRIQRNAINDELFNVVTQYNRMSAFYSLFTPQTTTDRQALPQE
ncbi:unnamed protein product [Adineta ricciae]|uniref:Uncharacterized protein n=2 Tax=Adineta ricciae TaxID=249248 RepID=A0A815IS97_ADIRI|nr:unnamed protein product [Adineta ricciae]